MNAIHPTYDHDFAEGRCLRCGRLEATRILKFGDCKLCDGSGLVMGGDEYQQCPECRLRARRNGAADATAIVAASLL